MLHKPPCRQIEKQARTFVAYPAPGDAGRNMTWDLRAPAPTPSHLRATVAIKGSFRGAEF
ncbi:hypothetical protein NUBL22817_50650 [Klebsiella pneumoniae]|nr:hypothetical protein NUBL22817_50650 [Klebsiella pneumoniae]